MTAPGSVREALIAEAIGDLGRLTQKTQALQAEMEKSRRSLVATQAQLASQLAAFNAEILGMCTNAKVQVAKHIVARAEEAAQHTAQVQALAMADAARLAFDKELGAGWRRLNALIQPLLDQRARRWESFLTHGATAIVASALTLLTGTVIWWR